MVNVDVSELLFLGAAIAGFAGFVGIQLAHFFAITRLRAQPLARCPVCRKHVSRRVTDCPACGYPL